MNQQADQQITQKYLFIITPIEIKSSSKIKTTNRKSILIKLGNKTGKCTQLNTPLELQIDVLYSKTLQKYCPIKGIIKIYDVSQDGSEIISCVGGFQTDEILNEGKTRVLLEKQIGTSKLKMDINIINKGQRKASFDSVEPLIKQTITAEGSLVREKSLSKKKQIQKSTSSSGSMVPGRAPTNSFSSTQASTHARKSSNLQGIQSNSRQIQIPYKNTSSSINKSLQKINQALNFKRLEDSSSISSRANEVLVRAQVQTIKQQLADQKRKSTLHEDRYNKANQKLTNIKAYLAYYQTQIKSYLQPFRKIISNLQLNDGSLTAQLDESTSRYSIKYKSKDIQNTFQEFITLIIRKTQQSLPVVELDYQSLQGSRSLHQLQQNKKQLSILKKLATEKDKKIFSLQRQIQGVQVTIRNLKETNKHLAEENSYLRQKNDQVELSLYHKETTIESLQRQVDKLNDILHQQESKHYNSCLQIDELKEEVSNCMETIQKYRQKYGDLKNVKNRAIEMQIKQCLRWIDQQNRDLQMSDIQETAQSEHEEDRGDSLSSVIRGIEIEKMPKEQMSVIRDELVKILEKVDNLMAK